MRILPRLLMVGFVSAWFALAAGLRAADEPAKTDLKWVAEHYTKFEYRIPMRDGVRLFTRVYLPKDDSQAWPILLTRTPYAVKPYGDDNYDNFSGSYATLARDTFILVVQDVRGRFGSEGTFEHMRPFLVNKRGPRDTDESTDAWDTIDWLVKNIPNNNGKVGLFGISYPGFYTSMGMIDSHPALKAASPQAPITDWFVGDDMHHNGALLLVQNFAFFAWFHRPVDDPLHESIPGFTYGTPDGYDYFLRLGAVGNTLPLLAKSQPNFWDDIIAHPDYDAFWQARNIRPHLRNVHCAVMTVGGWFDAEDFFGALQTYAYTEHQNPGIPNTLVIGPWTHGSWSRADGDKLGDVDFRAQTGKFYRENIELPFFRRYLKGDTTYVPPEAHIFETGTNRWRKFDSWPPKQAQERILFLGTHGELGWKAPAKSGAEFDEFISDPAKPVPYTMHRMTDYPKAYPVEDQTFATSRPDVLAYETPPLEEDVTIAGPMTATLYVSTTGTDADWIVKVIDVYADDTANPDPNPRDVELGAYQQLVRGDVMRGRFRNSFEKPEPFTPGKVTKVEFTLPDVCHTFRRGHRIMVHVQSSWFPLVDRNPQTFVNIATAKPEDFRKATHRVYYGAGEQSEISVRVLANVEH